jgi:hypothetical protein
MRNNLITSKMTFNYGLKVFSYLLYLFAIMINIYTKIDTKISFFNLIIAFLWISISLYMFKKNFGSYANVTMLMCLAIYQVSEYGINFIILILHLNNIIALSLAGKNSLKSISNLIFVNFMAIWVSIMTHNERLFLMINLIIILNLITGYTVKLIIMKTSISIGRLVKKPLLIPNSFFYVILLVTQSLVILTFEQETKIQVNSLPQADLIGFTLMVLAIYVVTKIGGNARFFRSIRSAFILFASILISLAYSLNTIFVIIVSLLIYKIMIDSIFLIKDFAERINLFIVYNFFIYLYFLATNQSSVVLYTTLFLINIIEVPDVRNKIFRIVIGIRSEVRNDREQFRVEQLELLGKVMNSRIDPFKYLKYYGLTEFNITNHYQIYLNYGWKFGYSISEVLQEYWYQSELKRFGFLYPSFKWIANDLNENIQIIPEIDSNWMKSKYALQSPTRYFLAQGWKEGLSPNPLFELVHSYRRPVFRTLKDAMNSICNNRFG